MDETKSRKIAQCFYIFLLVFVLGWSFCQFLRHQIGIDAMEAICWGELLDFGTNKHPPLSGWVIASIFNLFGQNDHAVYFIGSTCVAIGMLFVYKLAKYFLTKEKAACAAMIMTACFYYTFQLFDDNFNCNTLSIALWPMIVYFYYKSVRENRLKDWILFGLTTGLGALTKYQIVFLVLALFIHFILFERKYFKQIGLYLAVLTGLIVISPHVIWLIKHDFFSFAYMTAQAEIDGDSVQVAIFSLKRLFSPLKFLADQVLAVGPCIGLYLILAFKNKNIQAGSESLNISDKVFLLSVCIIPAFAQGMMGLITGGYIHGSWGSIMIAFTGIVLFAFFPTKFDEKSFPFFVKMVYVVLFIWLTIMVIFSQLQVKHAISYPYESNIKAFHEIWDKQTNGADLKYIGGHIDYIFQFRVYDKSRPHVILESFGYKNPWEDHDDILKSGALIFSKKENKLEKTVHETIINLPEDYKITPEVFEYEIKNKTGRVKKFKVYYAVILPQR